MAFKLLLASSLAFTAVLAGSPTICSNPQLSCQNTTAVSDLCCFNAPGGQLLQTQFWDTSPSTGPSNSWTIHGLWPDHCDGTYDANCDASRAYTGAQIQSFLTSFGKTDLLSYMNTYWKDSGGNDPNFWSHEWSKHGTCISTLNPSCYSGYTSGEEVVDFFQKTVDLFQSLNSYQVLANAGIVPSSSQTYTSAEIVAALKASFGYEVTLGCTSGALNQLWYSFDVRGSIQLGTFVPTTPDGSKSTCPATGVKYLPKSGAAAPTTMQTATSAPASAAPSSSAAATSSAAAPSSSPTSTPGTGFSGTGYLQAYSNGANEGCLISGGKWYVGGTCAKYTATASGSGFTLKSSKGSCGVESGVFTCSSGTTATVFTADSSNELVYSGSSSFYASAVPSGSTQESVSTASDSVAVTFEWQAV